MIVFGIYNFCFDSFSMSDAFTLLANASSLSFSISFTFDDFVSGQKKMLTPDGVSGRSQKNSQFQRLFIKDELGLKDTFSV